MSLSKLSSWVSQWVGRIVTRYKVPAATACVFVVASVVYFTRGAQKKVNALFTASQLETLRSITDTLIPCDATAAEAYKNDPVMAAFFKRRASDLHVAELMCDQLCRHGTPEAVSQFQLLIKALDSSIGSFFLTGRWKRFAEQNVAEREGVLLNWSQSWWRSLRQGFSALHKLTASIYFSVMFDGQPNPNWNAIQYAWPATGAAPAPEEDRGLPVESVEGPMSLEVDAVVIGSGAGGGVAAGVLAKAGFRVAVLEKGSYFRDHEYRLNEMDGYGMLYERGAMMTTEDQAMAVLAGSCMGGGTTVNWNASLRTPPGVLQEWANKFGLRDCITSKWQESMDMVCRRANVGVDPIQCNGNNSVLERGCQRLNLRVSEIPRNTKNCDQRNCGWCQFGCRWGTKQSTVKNWLQDAAEMKARFFHRCFVHRVMVENGIATGVVASVFNERTNQTYPVTIRAKLVIAAAGSIHTPALLLRSGLTNPNIGKHLRLHPVSAVSGEFHDPVRSYQGSMMTRLCDEYSNLDGEHYGVRIEMAPVHPALASTAIPWMGGTHFKTMVARSAYAAQMIVLTRDKDSGYVTIDDQGLPRVHYHLSHRDADHLLQGVQAAVRIMVAAGAVRVGTVQFGLSPFNLAPPYLPHPLSTESKNGASELEKAVDQYLSDVRNVGVAPFAGSLFSAHQMGSCRMGGDASYSVFDPHGESWEVKNLYVADASAFPTASGANPMMTIQALSYYVAFFHMIPRLHSLVSNSGQQGNAKVAKPNL